MSLHELASPKTVYFLILPAGDANMAVMMSTVWMFGKRAPTSSSRKPLKKRLNKHRTAPLSLVCQVSCATIRFSSSQTQNRPNPRVTCHRGQMDQSLQMSTWASVDADAERDAAARSAQCTATSEVWEITCPWCTIEWLYSYVFVQVHCSRSGCMRNNR